MYAQKLIVVRQFVFFPLGFLFSVFLMFLLAFEGSGVYRKVREIGAMSFPQVSSKSNHRELKNERSLTTITLTSIKV